MAAAGARRMARVRVAGVDRRFLIAILGLALALRRRVLSTYTDLRNTLNRIKLAMAGGGFLGAEDFGF